MEQNQAVDLASELWHSLPDTLAADLSGVALRVIATPWAPLPEGVPPMRIRRDQRGFFHGVQRVLGSDDAGADPLDIDWDDEEAIQLSPASGWIVLVAANLRTQQELEACLLHEIGHALGMDDQKLHEELGL
jgi:predicted Zn-dependent protease with MMP-like domain